MKRSVKVSSGKMRRAKAARLCQVLMLVSALVACTAGTAPGQELDSRIVDRCGSLDRPALVASLVGPVAYRESYEAYPATLEHLSEIARAERRQDASGARVARERFKDWYSGHPTDGELALARAVIELQAPTRESDTDVRPLALQFYRALSGRMTPLLEMVSRPPNDLHVLRVFEATSAKADSTEAGVLLSFACEFLANKVGRHALHLLPSRYPSTRAAMEDSFLQLVVGRVGPGDSIAVSEAAAGLNHLKQ